MRIESYNIRMDSAGTRSSNSTRKLSVVLKGQGKVEDDSAKKSFADLYLNMSDEEQSEEKANTIQDRRDAWDRFSVGRARNISDKSPTAARDLQSVHQQFVLYLWRMFFGEEKAKKMSERYGIEDMSEQKQELLQQPRQMHVIQLQGVEEVYEQETQTLSFNSSGQVKTADGREIDFNLDVSMTSSFERYYRREGIEMARMCDPLVLNFTGDVADLSDMKFTFDLDCDGEAEEISSLTAGNGFLALDKNGDGIINDGSELFGAKSGDGFADLANYDLDGNGWIDENDDIFNALKVWYKDETGQDKLVNLKEAGVGAIYLGNAATDYNLRSNENADINGVIRRMGVFLYENATVGTMVHLDIAN